MLLSRLPLSIMIVLAISCATAQAADESALDIGSRRELFVDYLLIDRLLNTTLKLHEPKLAPEMTEPANNLVYGTEIQDRDGRPFPGFLLADCKTLVGDAIEQPVEWGKVADVSSLAGQPVRLRFELLEADVYAMQFRD